VFGFVIITFFFGDRRWPSLARDSRTPARYSVHTVGKAHIAPVAHQTEIYPSVLENSFKYVTHINPLARTHPQGRQVGKKW